jgi:pyruvate dehydrogenase E1 component beta subunit
MEGAGMNGAAQHSQTLHSLFAHIPGLKVVAPATPTGARGLMKSAIRCEDPVIFCESKENYFNPTRDTPTDEDFLIPIGEASVERPGEDVTVVATQRLFYEALDAADAVEANVEVIDPRSLYPLDTETIADSVAKTGRLVVADESPVSYGTHAEIASRIMENAFFSLNAPIQRVGVGDVPFPFSPPMEDEILPGQAEIEAAIGRTL